MISLITAIEGRHRTWWLVGGHVSNLCNCIKNLIGPNKSVCSSSPLVANWPAMSGMAGLWPELADILEDYPSNPDERVSPDWPEADAPSRGVNLTVQGPSGDLPGTHGYPSGTGQSLPGLDWGPGQGIAQHGQCTAAAEPYLQAAQASLPYSQQQQEQQQQQQGPGALEQLVLGEMQRQLRGAASALSTSSRLHELLRSCSLPQPSADLAGPTRAVGHTDGAGRGASTQLQAGHDPSSFSASGAHAAASGDSSGGLPASTAGPHAQQAPQQQQQQQQWQQQCGPWQQQAHQLQPVPWQQQWPEGQPQGLGQQGRQQQLRQPAGARMPPGMPATLGPSPSDAALGTALEQVTLAAAMEAAFALPPQLPLQQQSVDPEYQLQQAALPSLCASTAAGAGARGQREPQSLVEQRGAVAVKAESQRCSQEEGEEGLPSDADYTEKTRKRIPDRRKVAWDKLVQRMEGMEADIEREEADMEQARLAGDMIESVLDYQQDIESVLLAAKQQEEEQARHHSLEPPQEYISVYERHRAGPRSLLWRRSVAANPPPTYVFVDDDPFGLEMLRRYAPAGHREEADPQGRLTKAPPFIKVVQDYVAIVQAMQEAIREAQKAGEALVERLGCSSNREAAGPAEAAAAGPAGGLPADLMTINTIDEMLFEKQGSHVLSLSDAAAAITAASDAATASAMYVATGRAACRIPAARQPGSGSCSPATSAAPRPAEDGSEPSARPEASIEDEELSFSPQAQPQQAQQQQQPPVARQHSQQQQEEGRGADDEGHGEGEDRWALMLRRMVAAAELMGGLPGTQVEGGLLIEQPDGPYFFDQPSQHHVAKLMHKVGALLWQQALLFPNYFLRLSITNLGTGEEDSGSEQSLADWDQMLGSLMLRPCQLQLIAQLYREYTSKVRPLRAKRCKIVSRLQQVHRRLCTTAISAQEHAAIQLELVKLASMVKQTCDAENAVYLTGGAGVFRAMLFPLQKMQLLTLSFPRFPQFTLIGEAVLRRLGLQQHA